MASFIAQRDRIFGGIITWITLSVAAKLPIGTPGKLCCVRQTAFAPQPCGAPRPAARWVAAVATVARTARPSAPPTWRLVLSRPEARPLSARGTVAAIVSGTKVTPMLAPTSSSGTSREPGWLEPAEAGGAGAGASGHVVED